MRQALTPDGPAAEFPLYERFPVGESVIPPCGTLSSARSASAGKGRAVVEQAVPDIAEELSRAFAED